MKFRALIFGSVFLFVFLFLPGESSAVRRNGYVSVDETTDALLVVDYSHSETHEGSHFAAHYSNDTTNTGEMTCIAFNTPNVTKWSHMVARGSASAAASFSIYRSTSIDVDEGTDLTIYNHNENSSNTSGHTTIETTPEAGKLTSYNEAQAAGANITTTTEIFHEDIGRTGSPVTASGGSATRLSEIVLKVNTQYAICVTADDDNDNTHNIIIDWYESTPKDQ